MKDSKSSNKNIIKVILFFVIVLVLMSITFRYCSIEDDTYTKEVWDCFYDLPIDSVDAIILGASSIREYYIAPEAYNQSGISTFALAVGNEPVAATKFLIDECRKTQSPDLFVIDLRNFIYYNVSDGAIRRVTDGMKPSINRIRLINTLLNKDEKWNNLIYISHFDHYFRFPLYHAQWERVLDGDSNKKTDVWMGFNIYDNIESFEAVPLEVLEAEVRPIQKPNEKVLKDLLNYCDGIDENILFVNVPSIYEEDKYGMINYAKSIVEEAGYEVLDLNYHIDDMNLDYASDFKDYFHVNVWGAVKVTDYLADYFVSNYGLPNHSNEEGFELWQEYYDDFAAVYNNLNNR